MTDWTRLLPADCLWCMADRLGSVLVRAPQYLLTASRAARFARRRASVPGQRRMCLAHAALRRRSRRAPLAHPTRVGYLPERALLLGQY